MKSQAHGILFANLVDMDEKYGHRNDWEGYANALMAFNNRILEIRAAMRPNDIFVITADHGNDPTRGLTAWYGLGNKELLDKIFKPKGTNHTREFVPALIYGKHINPVNIGIRKMVDISELVASYLGLVGFRPQLLRSGR